MSTMHNLVLKAGIAIFTTALMLSASSAQQAVNFKDKQIMMLIGSETGGGTDLFGRLVAQYLGKYLPGHPSVVVRNQPGAVGITVLNHMVKQTAPDGLTIVFGSNSQVDPFRYRKPQVLYTPSDFVYFGGVRRGGEFLVIGNSALPRLYDKKQAPVVVGTVGTYPRSGQQVAAWAIEYLGWNAKWVGGYRGTNDSILALQRGEVDLTAVAQFLQLQTLTATGNFTAVIQSGTLSEGNILARPEAPKVPVFASLMQGKISDPTAKQAFDYWLAIATMDKWLGALAQTPPEYVEAYREAFSKLAMDPDFLQQGKRISEDLVLISGKEVATLVKTLAATSPEAVSYMTSLLRKQGLEINE